MLIDILKFKDNPYRCEHVARSPVFSDYKNDPDPALPFEQVVAFVILLYSKDSFLNKKPLPILSQRRRSACFELGINYESPEWQELVFQLGSDKIMSLILDYLKEQNELLWSELIIIEAQIEENHRLRFAPIKNKKPDAPKKKKKKGEEDDEEDDDDLLIEDDSKYHIEASDKKSKLTDHFDKYFAKLKKIESEIFTDNTELKNKSRRLRQTIESLAR